jgi:Transglutaminase-like superfamily
MAAQDPAVQTPAGQDISYYARQSTVTDAGEMAWLLDGLPRDIATLQRIANGLVIHFRMDDPRAVGLSKERLTTEVDSRYADTMLSRLMKLDSRPLAERRPATHRLAGCCRDFTVLFLTMARSVGFAARGRVGFARYFFTGLNSDHEIAEVWDPDERRWRLVDAQLGDDHIDPNDGVRVDPADLPRERFLVAGEAWQRCRAGDADPQTFLVRPDVDIEMTRGWPYITHNLVLDLAALNNVETLLWDGWGLAAKGLMWSSVTEQEKQLLDRVAQLTSVAEPDLQALRSLYEGEPLLRVPDKVTSMSPVTLAAREVALR